MSKHRYNARVDNNQKEIVDVLRTVPGVSVEPGHDDILVGFRGVTYWFELKSSNAVSKRSGKVLESRKKKTQRELEASWNGQYAIVASLDEILKEIGVCR